VKSKTLTGDKINIADVIDKQISVLDYRIEDSKFGKRGSRCLHLQIEIENMTRLIFTGSEVLMDTLERVDKADFPFKTTIIKEMDWYKFT